MIINYKNHKIKLPCIVASRGRNPNNLSDRTAGSPTVQTLEVNYKGVCNVLTTFQKDNYVLEENKVDTDKKFVIRKLTPRECLRLMSFSDEDIDAIYASGISTSQIYKLAGNSIVVKVLEEIFGQMIDEEN